MTDFVSIWLVPSSEVLQALQDVVDTVTANNEAQSFLPHVTLLSGYAPYDAVASAVTRVCKALDPRARETIVGQLESAFLGAGNCFHHCLGYDFSFHERSSAFVASLTGSIQTILTDEQCALDPVTHPHISLMYLDRQAPEADFEYVQAQRALMPDAGQRVVFDRLVLVWGESPITSQQDVKTWQIRNSIALARPA